MRTDLENDVDSDGSVADGGGPAGEGLDDLDGLCQDFRRRFLVGSGEGHGQGGAEAVRLLDVGIAVRTLLLAVKVLLELDQRSVEPPGEQILDYWC